MEGISARYVRMAWILTLCVATIVGLFTVGRKKAVVPTLPVIAVAPSTYPKLNKVSPMKPEENVYSIAAARLGEHLTMNESVDPSDGCAEAISFILSHAGYTIPPLGIPLVKDLIDWMLANGFVEATEPTPGCIITAHNADPNVTDFAHAGIVLKYGIGSNDSRPAYLGRFMENYSSVEHWKSYFDVMHSSVTRFFIPA